MVLKFLSNISSILPFKLLPKISSRFLVLPFYHVINDSRLAHISNLYPVLSTKRFKKDLAFLCKNYKPIDINELTTLVENPIAFKNQPVFHLSFDDGLKEIYTTVAPILKSMGIPATIFTNTDFIDNKKLFFRYKSSILIEKIKKKGISTSQLQEACTYLNSRNIEEQVLISDILSLKYQDTPRIDNLGNILGVSFIKFLEDERPYLTKENITSLIADGFTIGSHSLDHPLFQKLPEMEQKRQISESLLYLKENFNLSNNYFSFPFNDEGVSKSTIDWLHSEAGCKLSFGISGLKTDCSPRHLHRIPMEGTNQTTEEIIRFAYLKYNINSTLGRGIIQRQ